MSVTFGLPISVQFMSNPSCIQKIPCFLSRYISSIFHCSIRVSGHVPVDCLQSISNYSNHAMCKRGGGGSRGHTGGKIFVRVRAQNYFGVPFIEPIWGQIPGPSPVSAPKGDFGDKIHGSCGRTTSKPQLGSVRWPNHILVKGVPRFLSLWVDSNFWVRLVPLFQ